jgi:DNA-binding response OmpR family regulator
MSKLNLPPARVSNVLVGIPHRGRSVHHAQHRGAARFPVTPLEYGVMLALVRASGRVMIRDEMRAEVWRTSIAGSNKVEAVVRSLRKKLGAFAPSIETVTGYGYRFNGWKRRT